MATIKEVSREARVSIKTVSRVINGSPEVAEPTRQHVLAVIEQLGYRPSALGQRLVTGKANAVGVVIPRTAGFVFGHAYYHEVLRGIGDVLGQHHLDLLLHLGRDDSDYVHLIHERKVDGLILLSIPIDDERAASLIASALPAVFTCRASEKQHSIDWVDCDPASGIDEAIDYLVGLGHRDFGFLQGPTRLMLPRLQLAAFETALARHDIAPRSEWILSGDYAFEAGRHHIDHLLTLSDRPTALLCSDDMIAIGAISAFTTAGLRIPRDCSVVGFDDVVIARYLTPPLTTIHQDGYGKGRRAAEILIASIAHGGVQDVVQETLPTSLIVRQSTAAPPDHRGGSSMA